MLVTGRSFRTLYLDELLPWKGGHPRIKGVFNQVPQETVVEIEFSEERRVVRVNGAEKARLSDLLGSFQAVEILPDDTQLVTGAPSRRRRFLDLAIAQWDHRYYQQILKYQQALRQRNKSLQLKFNLDRDALRIWNKILEENGSYILWQRKRVVDELNRELGPVYGGLTTTRESCLVSYVSRSSAASLEDIKTEYCEKLLETEARDIETGVTSFGPHRDDLAFLIQGKDADAYASEGQKRSFVIALKLALAHFLKQREGKDPMIILDDVLTQLDRSRRTGLMNALESFQSFISVTSMEFHKDLIPGGKWFRAENGSYSEIGRAA